MKLQAKAEHPADTTYIARGGAIGSAIKLKSGTDYTASLKIYSDSFDGNFTFGIQTNDAANPYKDGVTQYRATSFEGLEAKTGTSGEWREVTFNFTANFTVKESNSIGFFYKSSAANTIYIDDLVIKEADYAVVTFETPRQLWSSAFIAGQTLKGYPKKLLRFRNKLTAKNTFTMASLFCLLVESLFESMLNNTTLLGVSAASFISARTIGSIIFLSSIK